MNFRLIQKVINLKNDLRCQLDFYFNATNVLHDFKSEQKRYQAIAKNSLKKDERINIRLATKDLMGIQKKAMQEGLP